MATKPTAWQERGLVNLPSQLRGEEGTTINSPLQDRKAPRAMPEDDIDVLEPGAEDRAPWEDQTSWIIKTVDVTQTENQKFADIIQYTLRETHETLTESEEIPRELSEALCAEEEPKEPTDLSEAVFPPPPSSQSAGENCEKDCFSSLEGEVTEWISDAEVISDPTEDLTQQNSQEWPETPRHIEQAAQDVSNLPDGESVNGVGTSKSETSQPGQHINNTVNSPPYADESEEEEEVDLMSVQQVTDSTRHAARSVRQTEELLPQSQRELSPGGVNQEAEQQVFDQESPPLSAVAMVLSNQGGEASLDCGCVAAVRERCSGVGERAKGEDELTGEEGGQKESRLGTNKPARKAGGDGLLKHQPTVQTQEIRTGKQGCVVSLKESRDTRMRNNMYDDSQGYSGASADVSYRALEATTTSTGSPATETPIEREIRRAIQREQSLRRSRGLPNQQSSPEYVEIPLRKSLLCQSLSSKWSQNKDREFAGKKMQHEIHEETRREQDLVKIGKIPGFYDKGTVRQIKERKQLFEAFQTVQDSPLFNSVKNKNPSLSSESTEDLSLEGQEDVELQALTFGNSYEEKKPMLLNPIQNPNPAKAASEESTHRGPDLPDGTACQIVILENSRTPPAQKQNRVKAETAVVTAVKSGNPHNSYQRRGYNGLMDTEIQEEEEEEEAVASKENPFFKLRSSTNLVKVKQDILETKERERELQKMRVSLYGGVNGVVSSPQQEEAPCDVPEPSPKSERRSSALNVSQQSVSKFSAWPPVQAEAEKVNRPEVLQSPRTPRQKTPLVQLWESGLVNGYNLEDD